MCTPTVAYWYSVAEVNSTVPSIAAPAMPSATVSSPASTIHGSG
jgi:hypothetical protein